MCVCGQEEVLHIQAAISVFFFFKTLQAPSFFFFFLVMFHVFNKYFCQEKQETSVAKEHTSHSKPAVVRSCDVS